MGQGPLKNAVAIEKAISLSFKYKPFAPLLDYLLAHSLTHSKYLTRPELGTVIE